MPYARVGIPVSLDQAAATSVVAPSYTPVAGNALCIVVRANTDQVGHLVMSDGGVGNTYAIAGNADNGANASIFGIYALNVAGVPTVIQAATNNAQPHYGSIYVCEFSGLGLVSPFLGFAGATQNGPGLGTDAITSGNINLLAQPALVFGFSHNRTSATGGTNAAPSPGTGFSANTTVWNVTTGALQTCGTPEDRRVTALGNVAATCSIAAGAGDDFVTLAMAFAESQAVVTPNPFYFQRKILYFI